MYLAALPCGRGDLLLGLAGDGVGFVILLAVVAGLAPHLFALVQLLLRLSEIDLVGTQRRLGQDGDPLRQPLDEAPGDEELLPARASAVQPNLAGTQLRQQRSG